MLYGIKLLPLVGVLVGSIVLLADFFLTRLLF